MANSKSCARRASMVAFCLTVALPVLAQTPSNNQTPQVSQPESLRSEAFVSVASGQLTWGFDDEGFVRPNIGGGIRVRYLSGLALEGEVNHMLGGEDPTPGLVRRSRSVTFASANVSYFFSRSHIQQYVSGGIGALFWKGKESTSFEIAGKRTIEGKGEILELVPTEEHDRSDTALAGNLGVGVRIELARGVSLAPEFRCYISRYLLYRPSIGAAYRW